MSAGDSFVIVNTRAEYAEALATFQRLCYPRLPESDLFTAEDYRSHVRIFPEGQCTALLCTEGEDKIVAATTTMRAEFGELPAHFMEFIGYNTISTHDPNGAWLYGIDMSAHPAYRRLGLSLRFYEARAALVKRLGLRGEFVAGLLPGYERVRPHMSVEDYVAHVLAGEMTDPTLTPQLKSGFRLDRLLYGYVVDPRSDSFCTLLVRENPDVGGR